jgi:uncharacterized membrane protein YkvA (DUF1232 family)
LASDRAGDEEQRMTTAARASASGPTRILLACMPKSGSTFLTDVIESLPDFKRAKLSPSPSGGRQPELDEARLKAAGHGSFIAQEHVLYSDWTAKMCNDFALKPVVLVRSLPDAIVSICDHIRREGGARHLCLADPRAAGVDDATLEAMLAHFRAPWYVNFYMSWRMVRSKLMISYEELIDNPETTVGKIVDFAGASVTNRAIARAVGEVRDRRQSRLNVGVDGRGAKLKPEILRELAGLFDFFPEAADDPYVRGVQAQVEAALTGRAVPRLGPVALPSSATTPTPLVARPSPYAWLARAPRRYGYQATLIAVGLLYWVWPEDLIPDDKWYGHVDDAVFLTLLAFLAGRVSKRTPGLRELPNYLSRVIDRKLKFRR